MFIKSVAAGLLAFMVSGFSGSAMAQTQAPHVRRVPQRIQRFDRNHDGVLQRNEVPQRLQPWFNACDTDKDGVVTAKEIRAYNRAHRRHHHHANQTDA